MSFLNQLIECMDWLHTANSLRKDLSNDYETKWINAAGRTPDQAATDAGEGWKAGWVDWETGQMIIHRKK